MLPIPHMPIYLISVNCPTICFAQTIQVGVPGDFGMSLKSNPSSLFLFSWPSQALILSGLDYLVGSLTHLVLCLWCSSPKPFCSHIGLSKIQTWWYYQAKIQAFPRIEIRKPHHCSHIYPLTFPALLLLPASSSNSLVNTQYFSQTKLSTCSLWCDWLLLFLAHLVLSSGMSLSCCISHNSFYYPWSIYSLS